MSEPEEAPASANDSLGWGIFLGVVLHVFQLPLLFLLLTFAGLGGLAGIYAWSLTQFLYLGPAAWLAFHRGNRETAKGILAVAAIGVLLNGACDAAITHL